MSKEITKLEKSLGESFVADLRALPANELEFKLLQLAKHQQEIITTQNEDDELTNAKELVKELSAPYKEQLKENKTKSRFIHLLIKEKKGDDPA